MRLSYWFYLSMLACLLLSTPRSVQADTFKLKDGRTLEGSILDQNEDYYYLDTENEGVVSIEKNQIEGSSEAQEESATASPRKQISVSLKERNGKLAYWVKDIPPDNSVALVNQGGVSESEYKNALEKHAQTLSKKANELSETEKKEVLESCINQEVLLQKALADGISNGFPNKVTVVNRFLEIEHEKIKAILTEDSLRSLYEKNKPRYHKTVYIRALWRLIPADLSAEEMQRIYAEAQRDPANYKEWAVLAGGGYSPLGADWISEDIRFIGYDHKQKSAIRALFTASKGYLSPLMDWDASRKVFFYVMDKTGGEFLSFEDARGLILKDQVRVKYLGSPDEAPDETEKLFLAALQSGSYRDELIRKEIVDHAFWRNPKPLTETAVTLRKASEVRILKTDH